MAGQYEQLGCPFCDKGRISCLYFPSAWTEKRSYAAGKSKKTGHLSAETWLIQSGCSNCGKTAEDVEKELKRKNII